MVVARGVEPRSQEWKSWVLTDRRCDHSGAESRIWTDDLRITKALHYPCAISAWCGGKSGTWTRTLVKQQILSLPWLPLHHLPKSGGFCEIWTRKPEGRLILSQLCIPFHQEAINRCLSSESDWLSHNHRNGRRGGIWTHDQLDISQLRWPLRYPPKMVASVNIAQI